jgi:chloramphenicol 3-O-phosphotransferase
MVLTRWMYMVQSVYSTFSVHVVGVEVEVEVEAEVEVEEEDEGNEGRK